MFSQNFECPMGKDIKKEKSCKGCRVDGTLKNACAARCSVYKETVGKAKVED